MSRIIIFITAMVLSVSPCPEAETQTVQPLRAVVDISIGETVQTSLCDGNTVKLTLLGIEEIRDVFRDAVREARVKVRVNGSELSLVSAMYNLPVSVGSVQIDCPITRGYYSNSGADAWGLKKDARFRLWPAASPLINPGSFVYPAGQRWFAGDTQMSNEPCFVDAGENPDTQKIYYHNGLDFGGAEGMVDVYAAAGGIVVSKAGAVLEEYKNDTPVSPRYDVIYVLDDRGWYYRYSHLKSFETNVIPGERVSMGQKLGELGKEGDSGGWSHLHFDIFCRQPSGAWGTEEAYAYIWEAYVNQFGPPVLAVARPHHLAAVGGTVTLDGSKSRAFGGTIAACEWRLSDGRTVSGPVQTIAYDRPGVYSEILKVVTGAGDVDYDFTVVNVIDKNHSDRLPPTLHAAYSPTVGIQTGDPVTFKARAFRTGPGREVWDFGDGSPTVVSDSQPPGDQHDPAGYAVVIHRFKKAGYYIVRVERTGENGFRAVCHLDVRIEDIQ